MNRVIIGFIIILVIVAGFVVMTSQGEWALRIRFAFVSWFGHRPGTFSVNPKILKPGEIQHQQLPKELENRIRKCFARLAEVDKTPIESIVEDFKRDQNPDKEIVIWEAVADAYDGFLKSRKTDAATRQAAFGVLMHLSTSNARDVEIKKLRQEPLTDSDIELLKKLMR